MTCDKFKNKMVFEHRLGNTIIKSITTSKGEVTRFTKNDYNQISLIGKNIANTEVVRLFYDT
jgi:hypothetical protein